MSDYSTSSSYYNVPLEIAKIDNRILPQNYKLIFVLIFSFKEKGFSGWDGYFRRTLGFGKSTVQRGLKKLQEVGLINRDTEKHRGKVIKRTITPQKNYKDVFGIPANIFTSRELTATDKLIYGILAYDANIGVQADKPSKLSNAELGAKIGISPNLVSKRLKYLSEHKKIEIEYSDDNQCRIIRPLIPLYSYSKTLSFLSLNSQRITPKDEKNVKKKATQLAIKYGDGLTRSVMEQLIWEEVVSLSEPELFFERVEELLIDKSKEQPLKE